LTYPVCSVHGSPGECTTGSDCLDLGGGINYCFKTCASSSECPSGYVCDIPGFVCST